MHVVIRSIQDEDAVRLGIPTIHMLPKRRSYRRAWMRQAEYELPEGYTIVGTDGKEPGIYNAAGHHCPLLDSIYSGSNEGCPMLVDNDLPDGKQMIFLKKVCNLTFELLKK